MMREAATEAGKRALLVWVAAVIVVMIGLTVFSNREHLPRWLWRWQVEQIIDRIQQP
jgi:hypothetical protein